MLKEFVLHDIGNCQISEREIELFLKTNTQFAGREILTRLDLKQVFEVPFKEVRSQAIQEVSGRRDMKSYGTRPM
jgi:hypothetical protein